MSAHSAPSQTYYSAISPDSSAARKVSIGEGSPTISVTQGALMKELLGMRDGVRVCSRLHAVVHEFRRAHQIGSASVANRDEIITKYSVDNAPSEQAQAIARLSNPTTYAELRHGGRLLSPYPPLSSSELASLCDEIRAALVWKSST